MVDTLGVIEAIDAEHHVIGRAQFDPDFPGPRLDSWIVGTIDEVGGVDGDRERAYSDKAFVVVDDGVIASCAQDAPSESRKVGGGTGYLEADEIGAQEALEDLSSPGQLHEQLLGRKGDVEE